MQTIKELTEQEFNQRAGDIIRQLHRECNMLEQEDMLHELFIGYLEARSNEDNENVRYQYIILRNLLRKALFIEPNFTYHYKTQNNEQHAQTT